MTAALSVFGLSLLLIVLAARWVFRDSAPPKL